MELQSDFRDLLASFDAAGVEYLVVGGYALAFHGAPRYTGDLDVPFIGREAFVANKRATGRTRDLADLEDLGEREG